MSLETTNQLGPASEGADGVHRVPFSLLDTDLYKLTMQNAVHHHHPLSQADYRFTNRALGMRFTKGTGRVFRGLVKDLQTLRLTPKEKDYLSLHCPYLQPDYVDWLAQLQLDPEKQVEVVWRSAKSGSEGEEEGSEEVKNPEGWSEGDVRDEGEGEEVLGEVEIRVRGKWVEVILYEVILMALLSEAYFRHTVPDEWTFSPTDVRQKAANKAYTLLSRSNGNLVFSEFGTRRRRSWEVQKLVLEGLTEGEKRYWAEVGGRNGKKGGLIGTSNVRFAMMFGIKPVGTIAHEWIMAIGAKRNYDRPNGTAMDLWEEVYPSSPTSPLHTMLTDTYTVKVFFDEFLSDPTRASRWNALRHDSGDPIEFAKLAKQTWEKVDRALGRPVGANKGRVIFSDGLDVDTALDIWEQCEKIGVDASFGIGTHLTNDFTLVSDPTKTSKPLNIVIKLRKIDGLECVKLSDDRGKWTGDEQEVQRCRQALGLQDD